MWTRVSLREVHVNTCLGCVLTSAIKVMFYTFCPSNFTLFIKAKQRIHIEAMTMTCCTLSSLKLFAFILCRFITYTSLKF